MSCIMDGTELDGVACLEQDCCYWCREIKKCTYIPPDHQGGVIIDNRNPEKLAGKKENVLRQYQKEGPIWLAERTRRGNEVGG